MSPTTSQKIKIRPKDWRGLFAADVPHYGQVTSTWMEVFGIYTNEVVFTGGPDRWLDFARLALEEEPFLSCRLVGEPRLEEVTPEVHLVLTQLLDREVSYRKHRRDLLFKADCDFEKCDGGQWSAVFSELLHGLISDAEMLTDDRDRSQVVYFAVALKQRIHALHAFSKRGEKA